jgi:GDPmannose 4,6-dehydratase
MAFACTGILSTRIALAAGTVCDAENSQSSDCVGSNERLKLGNIAIQRDWGWAPDYVEAMWKMLKQNNADDYVIATGRTISLEYFISMVFEHFSLDWRAYVEADPALLRPSDIPVGRADPSKAKRLLDWNSKTTAEQVIARMCDAR